MFLARSAAVLERIPVETAATALGHPLGCSGVRILTTLINIIKHQNVGHCLATMCIGKGQGIATILWRT